MAGVAAIGARQRFNPLNARMNYSHPLAMGLVFYGLPYLGVDLMKNRNADSFLGYRDAGGFGAACRLAWTNARTTDMSFTTGAHTIGMAYNFVGSASFGQQVIRRASYTSETVNSGWEHGVQTGTLSMNVMFRNNGSLNYLFTSSTFLRHVVQFSTTNGTTKQIYGNALQLASSTSGNLLPVDSTTDLDMNFSSTSASVVCAWSRVLSTNEIAMFTADPYCILSY